MLLSRAKMANLRKQKGRNKASKAKTQHLTAKKANKAFALIGRHGMPQKGLKLLREAAEERDALIMY